MSSVAEMSGGSPGAALSAAERAYAAIRDAIQDGRLVRGQMLSESELAAQLQVSRTPVRSALARLRDEGWVTIFPKRGALVRTLTPQETRESAEVRHALETAGVRLASAATRAALAGVLEPNLHEQAEALATGDVGRFTAVAARFHRAFVELAENGEMERIYDRIHDRQVLSILASADRLAAGPDVVLAEHRALLRCAAAGEWADFATRLGEHQHRAHGLEAPTPPGAGP